MKNILLIAAALLFIGKGISLAFNNTMFRSDKVLTVKFNSVPPIVKFAGDIGVYYRGYKVGKAKCKNLSQDQKHIVFCLQINYKNLKLPKNTEIILKTQDILGDRYFDLIYPENPSAEMLADGDVVEGRTVAVYERIDKYLVEQMEKGELGALISNLNALTQGSKKDLKELKSLLKETPQMLDKTITNLEALNKALPQVNTGIEKVNEQIPYTNQQLSSLNPKIPVIPQDVIDRADKTLQRYDCIGGALSKTMSKDRLFFRFLFGRPGEPFKDCICK